MNAGYGNFVVSTTTDETVGFISGMRDQEDSGYVKRDFLHQVSLPVCATTALHVNVDCRNKMIAWCYQVVDFCKFNRETVEIAASILDRFMLTQAGATAMMDRSIYQLAAMTCLYTAVKIHEPEAMDPRLVSTLSRNTYSPQEVEAMEATILFAIQWRVNPPTSMAFVRYFMELIPVEAIIPEMRDTAYDLAKYQSELAVSDYSFIGVRPSIVAFCSLMNSLETLNLDDQVLGYVGYILAQSIGIDCNHDHVMEVQNFLYQAVMHQQPTAGGIVMSTPTSNCPANKSASRRSSFEFSPRSVA